MSEFLNEDPAIPVGRLGQRGWGGGSGVIAEDAIGIPFDVTFILGQGEGGESVEGLLLSWLSLSICSCSLVTFVSIADNCSSLSTGRWVWEVMVSRQSRLSEVSTLDIAMLSLSARPLLFARTLLALWSSQVLRSDMALSTSFLMVWMIRSWDL